MSGYMICKAITEREREIMHDQWWGEHSINVGDV